MQNVEIVSNEEKNNNKTVSLKYVSLREFILFKEEFLKALGDYKKEINTNFLKEKQKFDIFFEKTSNLIKQQNDKNNFITKINFIEEKNDILSQIKKLETDFNNQLMVNKINLSTYQKDFSDACFKYDKIISDNLLVSGLIGTSCKFPNLKEYILNNKEEMSINALETKKNSLELKEYKNKMDNINEQLKFQIMTMKNNFQAFMEIKTNEINEKYEEFEKAIIDKVTKLNVKNSGLVESLKEQEDKMINGVKFIEKLKDEAIENNTNTINIISKENKNVINQLNQTKKEFKSLKKNIMDLSTLLIKKDNDKNKKNKEAVINSFNNMMNDLIKEIYLKEKKNEFNYNSFNNYNVNNNNFSSLIFSNDDNNSYNNEINKSNQIKIRTLTQNLSNDLNEVDKKLPLKIKLSDNISEKKIKSKFSKDININISNKLNNENKNDNQNDLIKKKSNNKITRSYIYGNKKSEQINDIINLNKNEAKKEDNSTNENKEKKVNNSLNLNLLNIKKNKTEIEEKQKQIDKNEYIKEEEDKNKNNINDNNENKVIVVKEKEENKIEKERNKEEEKEEEVKIDFIDEENKDSDKESEKSNNKLISISHQDIHNKSLNNDNKKKNIDKYYKTYSNSKSISIRFDNNNLKNLEKTKTFLNQNNNKNNIKLYNDNNIKNIKQINIPNNNGNRALALGYNYSKRSQALKKSDLPITKNIFSLYDYLRTNKAPKSFKSNKTEDIDSVYMRMLEKQNRINQGDIYKKFLSKEVLEKINIIKDEEIIDKPLLCNQGNFEVRKCTGDVEKKLLHLEYFMKKKFDELVREIKIFIPIHFNAYTRDYNIIEK